MNQAPGQASLGASDPYQQLPLAGSSSLPPGSSKIYKSSDHSHGSSLRDNSCSSSSRHDATSTNNNSSSSSSKPLLSLSILPVHLQHQLLTHASQQLDQRTCYGIIPRVNRLWDQLSPTTLSSLSLTFTSATSPRYFTCWLLKHPQAPLQHLSLDFKYVDLSADVSRNLVQTISKSAATRQLSSLHLSNLPLDSTHTSSLPFLTALTALHLPSCDLNADALEPLLDLKQLKSLDLAFNPLRSIAELLPDLAKALQQLEVMDMSGLGLPGRTVALFRNFPSLRKVVVPLAALPMNMPLLLGPSPLPCASIVFMWDVVPQQDTVACIQRGQGLLESVVLNGFRGPQLAELFSALGRVTTLRHLCLMCGELRPAVPALLTLTQLTSLHIDQCRAPAEDLAEVLAALPGLRRLAMRPYADLGGDSSSASYAVPALPHLTALTLVQGDESLQQSMEVFGPLHRFPELRELKLHSAPTLENVRGHIQPLTDLECLTLNMLAESALAEVLVPLRKLKQLQLQGLAFLAGSQEAREQLPAEALAFTCLTQLQSLELSLGYTENCNFKTKVWQSACMYTAALILFVLLTELLGKHCGCR